MQLWKTLGQAEYLALAQKAPTVAREGRIEIMAVISKTCVIFEGVGDRTFES